MLDVSVLEVSVVEGRAGGGGGGGRGGAADTALKTKTPHDNVGNQRIESYLTMTCIGVQVYCDASVCCRESSSSFRCWKVSRCVSVIQSISVHKKSTDRVLSYNDMHRRASVL